MVTVDGRPYVEIGCLERSCTSLDTFCFPYPAAFDSVPWLQESDLAGDVLINAIPFCLDLWNSFLLLAVHS